MCKNNDFMVKNKETKTHFPNNSIFGHPDCSTRKAVEVQVLRVIIICRWNDI